jgi:hypothetical protein
MNRKILLIAGGLIGIMVVFAIGVYTHPAIADISNSTDENSTTNNSSVEYLYFDNSTPEATAISIARLNEGFNGFCDDMVVNVSLTSNGKYWKVNMREDGYDDWVVTIDAKTLMSKKNGGTGGPTNMWRSLDELKVNYIAELQGGQDANFDRPYKVTLNGKTTWKVRTYTFTENGRELYGYIYVDVATGKSKDVDLNGSTEGWMTLTEVDQELDNLNYYPFDRTSFRDALRDLYPE